MVKKSRSQTSGMLAGVAHSYDAPAPEWIDAIRRFADLTDHIINKWDPLTVWLSAAYLKQCREEVPNLSQEGLAQKTGISRGVIANYENDVTDFGWERAVKVYKALEGLGSASAAQAMLNITEIDKEISRATLHLIDGKREAVKGHLAKAEAEGQRLRGKLGLSKDARIKSRI